MPTGSAAPSGLFDRALIAGRRARAGAAPDFVTGLALAELGERLATVNRRFKKAVLVGPSLGGVEPALAMIDTLEIVATLTPKETDDLPVPAARNYDLIASLLDLQAVNDVPGTLIRLRRLLRPDGLFIAVFLGGRSLYELRTAWIKADSALAGGTYARVAPFMDVRDAGALLQRTGFALPVADVDSHAVRYADPLKLMRELKNLGAANPLREKPKKPVTKTHLAAAVAAYPRDADGRITATLELVWMSGWAPHDSQQRPLTPGSAEISLEKVLKDKSG